MRKTARTATVLAVASVGLVGGLVQPAASSVPTHQASADRADSARRAPCKGVPHCRFMGRFNVNRNGVPDRVGLVNRDRDGFVRRARVTLRVRTDQGNLLRQRVVVKRWRGPVWFGRANLNGRRGKEIVLGARRDKYTRPAPIGDGQQVSFSKGFHVISFKPGSGLKRHRAPGDARFWWLTSPRGVKWGSGGSAQFSGEWGWWRKRVNGQVRIQKRRIQTGGAVGIWTRKTVWVWKRGDWRLRGGKPIPNAKRFGGWHVRGLDVW